MPRPLPLFADRTEAGLKLLPLLAARGFDRPLVYALPRGGVPVALPIAQGLHAPLDLLLVRKLGVPWQPELDFGAIAEGLAEPLLNQDIIAHTGLTEDIMAPVLESEKQELTRRSAVYLKGRRRQDPKGRIAILVDDGLATGITARAGLAALRKQGAARLVLAPPPACQPCMPPADAFDLRGSQGGWQAGNSGFFFLQNLGESTRAAHLPAGLQVTLYRVTAVSQQTRARQVLEAVYAIEAGQPTALHRILWRQRLREP